MDFDVALPELRAEVLEKLDLLVGELQLTLQAVHVASSEVRVDPACSSQVREEADHDQDTIQDPRQPMVSLPL